MSTFELDRLISYEDEALLSELRRVAALVNSPCLTRSDFDEHSRAHSSGIVRRFKGWQQALQRAGLGDRYGGAPIARRIVGRTFSDEQLIDELRAVSAKIGGRPVTVEVFNQHANMSAETVRRRFGSWWAALKQAELEISNRGRRYSDDDYFENLLTVWTRFGRQPTYGEMELPPSSISSGAYEAKWGTWRKALLAFIERVNSDMRQNEAQVAPIRKETKTQSRKARHSRPHWVNGSREASDKTGTTVRSLEERSIPLCLVRGEPRHASQLRIACRPHRSVVPKRKDHRREPSLSLRNLQSREERETRSRDQLIRTMIRIPRNNR